MSNLDLFELNVEKNESIVEFFIEILGNKNKRWWVRCKAAEALGNIGDVRAVEPLIKALESKDDNVMYEIVVALGKIGDARAVEILIKAFEYSKIESHRISTPGYIIDTAYDTIDDSTPKEAVKALAIIGKPAVVPLTKAIGHKDYDVVRYATDALIMIGKPAVEHLLNALKDENERIRHISIAKVLGHIGDARAVEPLIQVLKDKDIDNNVRNEAAMALGNIGDARAVEPLIKVLEDKDEYISRGAAMALGNIGDARAVEPLIKALESEHENVKYAIAVALGKIGDARAIGFLVKYLGYGRDASDIEDTLIKIGKSAVESLINALDDENERIRRIRIAKVLGNIGDARAVEPLIKVLGDEDAEIRYGAAESLKKITPYLEVRASTVFCSECFCRFKKHEAKISFFKFITYYACHKCHSTVHLIENIEKAVAVLDYSFEETYIHNGTTIFVNWFKHKESFDFDEIQIKDANDFDIEEMVVKLKNDTYANRKKKPGSIPVYIASNLKLAQARMKILNDTFGQIKIRD